MSRHPMVSKVNRAFEESFREWRAPHSIHLRLLGDCMLKVIKDLHRTEPEEYPDLRGMMNMSYGSAYELWMTERLKMAGLLKYNGVLGQDLQINVRVAQYYGNGYMDAWIVDEGEDYGIEIKTCGSRRFDQLLKDHKPDRLHLFQLMAYLHFLKIPKGRLIYIDRETTLQNRDGEDIARWEIVEVTYDPELGSKLERRLKILNKHRLEGTLPEKEPKSADDKRCTWCSYRKECWGTRADSGKIGGNARAKRIAQDSSARRRQRSDLTGTKGTK